MKIPYGESNFKKVITEGFVYLDKTDYIPKLEAAGSHLFLLRPRRFGKSLFLSMLEYYYDVAYQHEFDALFGKLYSGQQPTPLRSSYQVLFMDFSGIDTDTGHDAILQRFTSKVDMHLQTFLRRYAYPDSYQVAIREKATPADKMQQFVELLGEHKFLLLIDEYDHFANSILAADMKLFLRIMGKGGFVRSFYETLKTATQRGTLDRLFVTGVTPIMLDSMTSGFNIGQNLSLHEDFNEAIGFTKADVASLLQPLADTCTVGSEQLLADVTRWYNGYRFNLKAPEMVYNANMVLYFVKNFDLHRCEYPDPMMDENIASDYGKIMGMFSIGNRDTNFAVLDELINTEEVTALQRRKFEFDKGFDRDAFISLLAYMGFITLYRKTLAGDTFVIPNYAIREFYFHYFKVELERRNQMSIPNHTLRLAVEKLALYAETQIYFVQSESELNRKYPDILLLERNPIAVPSQYLIELKYSKKGDKETGWVAKKQEGLDQVQGYLQLPEIAALKNLTAWLLVTDGEQVEIVRVG